MSVLFYWPLTMDYGFMTKKCTQIQNDIQHIWKYLGNPAPRERPAALATLVYQAYGLSEVEIKIVEGRRECLVKKVQS